MRKIKDFGAFIVISLICVSIVGGSVLAEDGEYNRRKEITSEGVIDYSNNTVVFDSSDLIYLADEIDDLERTYKSKTVEALNQINTFYTSVNGDISHDPDDNHVSADAAPELSFDDLYQGIIKSQSVDHLSGVQAKDAAENPLYYADQNASERNDLITTTTDANDYPVLIQRVAKENLTAGTAAWIDGNLIIGTGADNTAYYKSGYDNGYSESTIYHKSNWEATITLHLKFPTTDSDGYNAYISETITCIDGETTCSISKNVYDDWGKLVTGNSWINYTNVRTAMYIESVTLTSFEFLD